MGASSGRPSGETPNAGQARAEDAGRYEVFATLGRGGMADVFLAVSRGPKGFNKLVVLKKLRAHLTDDPSFREMFLDEARLAARLNHSNVVQSYEVGQGNGAYFIAMEYLDGQPLNRLLEKLRGKGERLDPALAARIAADACSGLGHAHELCDYDGAPLRIIHRDVTPHNIFLTYDGQVKLVDFGIAKATLSRAETEIGVLKGKVAYMAPEQALGGEIDSRVDLFAMGLVLWEMLAGRALFSADNAANTLHRLMNEPIPRPSTVVPDLDPQLDALVMRALEKDPAARFQSARQMREALESWLRSVNRSVRGEECGALVSSRFEGVRADTQREIRKYMSDAAPAMRGSLMSLASIEQVERGGGNAIAALVDLGAGSGLFTPSGGKIDGKSGAKSDAVAQGELARRRRRVVALVALLVFTFAIAGFLVWRRGASPPPPETSPTVEALPTAPTASPTALATTLATAPATATAAPSSAPATPPTSSPVATAQAPRGNRAPRGGHHPIAPSPSPSSLPAPAATAAGAPGFLTLDTYPWTRVSENGRVLGTTPLVHVSLPAGPHALVLENADLGIRQPYTATIASGETLTRRLGLR